MRGVNMKILLAVDDSKFSEAAVEMVARQNRPETTEVLVLHILEPLAANFPSMSLTTYASADWDRIQKDLLDRCQELVNKVADQLRAQRFRTESLVQVGLPRTYIIDAAAKWQADLIVLGAHGKRGMERFLLGSVSEFVARHAKCSVEIVRIPLGVEQPVASTPEQS
jgi:nucleotide-binding universal stress UspA family protein